jgi:hypothetical protein
MGTRDRQLSRCESGDLPFAKRGWGALYVVVLLLLRLRAGEREVAAGRRSCWL